MKKYDLIIVGQGIAGTLLAFHALQRNLNILVIDIGIERSASFISSGLINPITGRRFNKSWMIDALLPFAAKTYSDLQSLLGETILHKQEIFRVIHSIKEQNDLLAMVNAEGYENYLPRDLEYLDQQCFKNDFGCLPIHNSLRIDTRILFPAFRKFLHKTDRLLEENFEHNALRIFEDRIEYKHISAERILFAEGIAVLQNPYFSALPVVGNKGQCLHITAGLGEMKNTLVNGGILLPMEEKDMYYLGATYEWKYSHEEADEFGLKHLEDVLHKTICTPYQIKKQEVAIRPTTPDRRPILGVHPEHKNLFVMNAMGTKGISLAPYFAAHLLDHIFDGKELLKEVNLSRFSA